MKRFVFLKPLLRHLLLLLVGMTFALNASSAENDCKWVFELWSIDDDIPILKLDFADFEPSVTFGDNQLVVTTKYLEVEFYDLNEIRKITYLFNDGSGINDVVAETAMIKFKGDVIEFTAFEKGSNILVYAANGMLLMKRTVSDSGDCTLSLSSLSQGVYVVNVNGKTFKIVKK